MKTIKNIIKYESIIKNSRFIAIMYPLNSINNLDTYLEKTKKEYTKATHYCYAYILDNLKKSSDDNEPSGTAGMPILNVLEKNNFRNVLCIVVRYFGGIKLGAGGLVRAYSNSVINVLDENKDKIIELTEAFIIDLEIDYKELDKLNYLLNNPIIIEKEFNTNIRLKLKIKKEDIEILNNNNFKYKIIDNSYIEKSD